MKYPFHSARILFTLHALHMLDVVCSVPNSIPRLCILHLCSVAFQMQTHLEIVTL
jgi:hypothetical protein